MSDGWVIPYGRNLVSNPKPASATDFSGSGTTRTLTTERSYVGNASMRVEYPGVLAGGSERVDWFSGSLNHIAIAGGKTFTAAFRYSSDAPFTVGRVYLIVYYSDGTSFSHDAVELRDAVLPATGYAFARVDIPPFTADPAKTVARFRLDVRQPATPAVGALFLGGFDVRESADAPDGYIDGDQGAGFAWEGTPNASTSTRAAPSLFSAAALAVPAVVGIAGSFKMEKRLYRVNRLGVIQDDLTDEMIDATVSYDVQAEGPKGSVRLAMKRRGLIRALSNEYVAPEVTITRADGFVESGRLGLFSVEPATERHDLRSTYEYDGYDLLWQLAQDRYTSPSVLMQGDSFRAKFLHVLTVDAGLTEGVHFVIAQQNPGFASGNFGAAYGSSILSFLSQLTQGAGWDKPRTKLNGMIVLGPIPDILAAEPAATFATGPGSLVRWPFTVDPDPGELSNRVNVRGKFLDANGYAEWTSILPASHPISRERLGRWITATVENDALENNAAARLVAEGELARRSSIPVVATLTTRATIREPGEVYQLDLHSERDGEPIPLGQGRYWCTGWSMRLGEPWTMTHSLRRIVTVQEVL